MGGWISVGLGAAAALCPLPQHGGATVVMEHTPTTDHLVVCAPDVWVDMGHGHPEPPRPASALPSACHPSAPQAPVPPPAPRPSAPPSPAPAPAPRPPAPSSPAPAVEPIVTSPPRPAPSTARHAAPRAAAPRPVERIESVEELAPPADPVPDATPAPTTTSTPNSASAPVPAKVRQAFRWVPRLHYTGGPTRPAPAGMSTTMTTVVITLPGVLAAAALRPGSRRRSRA
ncbi:MULTISPECIES: hypothetical protein [unclassified Streptomyces]|uniref:hypothetical protein n=1 Tax=unclassified Streptomyces TaxID=2593676 RepID=UPI0037F3598B